MSFNAKITFTGICTFVPNQDESRFYVFMPNGEQELGTLDTVDGTIWKRHRGFLRFNLKDFAYAHGISALGDGDSGIFYFRRSDDEGGKGETGTELELHCPGASDLKADPMQIADLSLFAPEFSTINSDLITKHVSKAPATISMRMLLDKGNLKAQKILGNWRIPNTLNPKIDDPRLAPQQLVHEVVLELTGLNSLYFTAYSIPGGSTRRLDLAAADDQTVYITIANFCDDNPLQWPRKVPSNQPDVDFKWHYRLLNKDNSKALKSLLNGLELPFPLPVGSLNDSGANCYLSRAKAAVNF